MPSLGPKKKKPRSLQQQYQYSPLEKLTTHATTTLRREIKSLKSIEVAKISTKIKVAESPPLSLTQLLFETKNAPNQTILDVCFRRLGLDHTGLNNDPLAIHENKHPDDKFLRPFTEKLLSSPKLCAVMDQLNKKVTDHRRKQLNER